MAKRGEFASKMRYRIEHLCTSDEATVVRTHVPCMGPCTDQLGAVCFPDCWDRCVDASAERLLELGDDAASPASVVPRDCAQLDRELEEIRRLEGA